MLHYQSLSEGTPVVLIHGLFGSFDNLGMVAKALTASHRVISVDARNHGRSFHHEDMRYPAMAQDIFDILDHEGIDQCAVLGHSMGGKIAMEMALSAPQRISKLIVADIAPVTYQSHHQQIFDGLMSIDLSRVNNRNDADTQLAEFVPEVGVRQFLLKNLQRTDTGFGWRCNLQGLHQHYAQILASPAPGRQYDGPTLFIKGGDSDYILPTHRDVIMTFFPHSKAKIIASAGHWLHAEKPTAFNKIVSDFLS